MFLVPGDSCFFRALEPDTKFIPMTLSSRCILARRELRNDTVASILHLIKINLFVFSETYFSVSQKDYSNSLILTYTILL